MTARVGLVSLKKNQGEYFIYALLDLLLMYRWGREL